MAKYYISPFNFFYAKNEELGNKFTQSAFGGCFTSESDDYDLVTVLTMIAKGFEENELEFSEKNIDINYLIKGVLKKEFLLLRKY